MLESYVRPVYQYLFIKPLLKSISKWVLPNQITIAACLIGVASLPALGFGLIGFATVCVLFSGYLDTLDGALARFNGKISPSGTVLDITGDRIVELAIILGLFAIDPSQRGWYCLLMLGSCFICVTSFLVVGIFLPNNSEKPFHYTSGLIERAEAFVCFIVMMWLPEYFGLLAIIFTFLVFLTTYFRIKQFLGFFRHVEMPVLKNARVI